MGGSDVVINLSDILYESENSYLDVFVDGSTNIGMGCKQLNIPKFIHFSCLGTDIDHLSYYADTKFRGEDMAYACFPKVTIIKPGKFQKLKKGLIFGGEGKSIFKNLMNYTRLPIIPLPNSSGKHQPVWIEDVTNVVVEVINDDKYQEKTIELGGPNIYSTIEMFKEMIQDKSRLILPLPLFIIDFFAGIRQFLPNPKLVREQILMMKSEMTVNNVDRDVLTFQDFKIVPSSLKQILSIKK
jgi:uncharacterized protein YbjT (DUF2867 family)